LKRDGTHAAIAVKDEGAGIAAEELPNVFHFFAIRRGAKKHIEGGLGIGLHVAREIVEAHGGTIEARSEGVGRGSEFTIRLPLAQAAVDADTAPEEAANSEQLAILVVDEQPGRRGQPRRGAARARPRRARGLWRQRGDPARDEAQLRRGAGGHRHADGGRAGGGAADRALTAGRDTLLVAVTGWGAGADRERSKEAGFAYHLTKPVDYDTLGALLATAARRARP
jgi:hypothetical protein